MVAGKPVVLEISPKAGAYKLRMRNSNGLGLGEVFWQILDESGRAVFRTTQPEPIVALLAGRYTLKVRLRNRAMEFALDAKAGENKVVDLGG